MEYYFVLIFSLIVSIVIAVYMANKVSEQFDFYTPTALQRIDAPYEKMPYYPLPSQPGTFGENEIIVGKSGELAPILKKKKIIKTTK